MFEQVYKGKWLVVKLVPGFIEAHSGIQFGSPTMMGSRVPTYTAAQAWREGDIEGFSLTAEQAFAAACFEAGREYQRSRTLRKRIEQAVHDGWGWVEVSATVPLLAAQEVNTK